MINQQTTMKDESNIFWGEMAPCDHLLHLYDDDVVFLDALEGFVAGGILAGEAVIVIARPQHLEALHSRISARGVHVLKAQAEDIYIPLDAEEMLSKFMVKGWPDDELFTQLVHKLVLRAQGQSLGHKRKVRAFGEMVAVLWGRGDNAATVRLEYLWHELCLTQKFSLLCAYPKSGFTNHAAISMQEICDAHTRLVT